MKIVVTGAGGLLGRAVAARLLQDGAQVTGMDRIKPPRGWKGQWHLLTLDDPIDYTLFDSIDAVVHLAGIPSPGVIRDEALFRNNVCSTFNVLNAAGEAGVATAVIASSISIYGLVYAAEEVEPPEIPLSESSELRCADAYSLSKEVDEATGRMMNRRYGMRVAALRFPNVSNIETVFARSAEVQVDPSTAHRELWAYLTLEDAGRAISLVLASDFHGSVVANVVSSQSLHSGDLRASLRSFYPSVDSDYGAPVENGYSLRVAQETFGFRGSKVLPVSDRTPGVSTKP